MSQSPANTKSDAAKERAAKKKAAIEAAEKALGKKVHLTLAKPKKKIAKNKSPKEIRFHFTGVYDTKTKTLNIQPKKKSEKKKKEKKGEKGDTTEGSNGK